MRSGPSDLLPYQGRAHNLRPAPLARTMATAAAAAMGGFSARQRAAEGQWFNTEGQLAVLRHLEKLVQQV